MKQLVFPLFLGLGVLWFLLRTEKDRKTKLVGGVLVFLSTICFLLYSYGILGVGVSSWILDLFGKVGIIT